MSMGGPPPSSNGIVSIIGVAPYLSKNSSRSENFDREKERVRGGIRKNQRAWEFVG